MKNLYSNYSCINNLIGNDNNNHINVISSVNKLNFDGA